MQSKFSLHVPVGGYKRCASESGPEQTVLTCLCRPSAWSSSFTMINSHEVNGWVGIHCVQKFGTIHHIVHYIYTQYAHYWYSSVQLPFIYICNYIIYDLYVYMCICVCVCVYIFLYTYPYMHFILMLSVYPQQCLCNYTNYFMFIVLYLYFLQILFNASHHMCFTPMSAMTLCKYTKWLYVYMWQVNIVYIICIHTLFFYFCVGGSWFHIYPAHFPLCFWLTSCCNKFILSNLISKVMFRV